MNASDIIVEVQKGVRMFKAFSEAEKIIAFLQNLEQVEREVTAKVTAAREAQVAAETELATVTDRIADATAQAKRIVEDAEATAGEKFAKVNAEIRQAQAESNDALARKQAQVAAEDAKLADARAGVADATKELAELQSKIESAKAHIAKLLGA